MRASILATMLVGLFLTVSTTAQAKGKSKSKDNNQCHWSKVIKLQKEMHQANCGDDFVQARKAYLAALKKCSKPTPPPPTPKCESVACTPTEVRLPAPPPKIVEKPVYVTVLPPKPAPEPDYRRFRVGLSVFSFGYIFQSTNPNFDIIGAWGWGVMAQGQGFATRNLEINLAVGIGIGLDNVGSSPGHYRGWMAEGGARYWVTRHIGFGADIRADLIGLHGLDRNVLVIGGIPGVSFQGEAGGARFKLDIGVLGGAAYAERTPGRALSIGPRMNVIVSF